MPKNRATAGGSAGTGRKPISDLLSVTVWPRRVATPLYRGHAGATWQREVGRVDVICPGFVSDCLETLEEIAIEGKTIFMQAGGREFHYIPCLNQRDDWIEALADIAIENLQGWLGLRPSEEKLAQSRQRALAIGARQLGRLGSI